jgi:polyisoprenyl-teichoic acid--peptidoglycan teichoic acid transferase
MNDKLNENEQEPDGSESRFNTVIKPESTVKPQPVPVFESWLDPQPEPVKPVEPVYLEPAPVSVEPGHQAVQPPEVVEPIKSKPAKHKVNTKKPSFWLVMICLILIFVFFFTPVRVTTLVLGIDWRPSQSPWLGRSDTMILTTIPPVSPQVSMLSIPRDLWVTIPNHYDNRINTAHYFAELEAPGTGMQAAKEAVAANFGIKVNYAIRVKFTGFIDIVNAFGGVTVNLPKDMSGLKAGPNHLDGKQALAFVRDRKASDDFFRQERGQLFVASAIKEVLNPLKWPRIPAVLAVAAANIETDLPIWLWPRTAYALIFSAVKGFDAHTLDRSMITPWVTDEGAQVLAPNWDLMNPLIDGMFK